VPRPDDERLRRARRGLELIALFKFLKAATLVLAGCAMLGLLSRGFEQRAGLWLEQLSLGQGDRIVAGMAARALLLLHGASPRHLTMLAVGAFAYATIFLVEGIGLARGRRWAEFMTIGVTLSFLPFELMAVIHRVTWLRVGTLAVNMVVVSYLIWQLYSTRDLHRRPVAAQVA
jgi:uncharacterized membrane protein (DUF2068 family)